MKGGLEGLSVAQKGTRFLSAMEADRRNGSEPIRMLIFGVWLRLEL